MRKISAKIVADSVDIRGNRITSYLLTYPRMIHAEVMTHRMFTRNAASSRAIPFNKLLDSVKTDPFIPIAFQKDHKGMQGTEYIIDENSLRVAEAAWLSGANAAVACSTALNMTGVTKQLCNRLLEPYLWYTALVTATEYENFFNLRCPKYQSTTDGPFRSKEDAMERINESNGYLTDKDDFDYYQWQAWNKSGAEIHIQELAERMWEARKESNPKVLKAGQWHFPFGDNMDNEKIADVVSKRENIDREELRISNGSLNGKYHYIMEWYKVKVAIARCARLSYMTFDGEINYEKDVDMHDSLLLNQHMSPFEHCATTMNDNEYYNMFVKTTPRKGDHMNYFIHHDLGWCNNFRGFIQYRFLIENDNLQNGKKV